MARADPLTDERQSLYESDFYRWVEEQTRLLRQGALEHLDVVGRSQRVGDHLRVERDRGRLPEHVVPEGIEVARLPDLRSIARCVGSRHRQLPSSRRGCRDAYHDTVAGVHGRHAGPAMGYSSRRMLI